jgi:hypothetical protein
VAARWHYLQNDQPQGPVSAQDLRRLVVAGRLKPADLVWQEGTPEWIRAGRVKGLFPRTVPATAAAPEPDDDPLGAADDDTPDEPTDSVTAPATPPQPADPALTNGQPPAVMPPTVERPLPIVLVAFHAAVAGAVALLQAGSTSSADIGSQLESASGLIGGFGNLLGDALGDALGTEGGGITMPSPQGTLKTVGWVLGLIEVVSVPLIVFQLTVCYGLFKRAWWARRLTLATYSAVVVLGVLMWLPNVPGALRSRYTCEAVIAAVVLLYFTRPATRAYFGDGPISFRDLLIRPLRRSDPGGG